jgi:hypothetical protein
MKFDFFMTLPGLVIVLTLLGFVDQLLLRAGRAGVLPWRNSARQGQMSATGVEQLHGSGTQLPAPPRSLVCRCNSWTARSWP